MEFLIVENVVDGKEGFGPHLVEVWAAPSTTKRRGEMFVTLFLSAIAWHGELMRIEEFAKQVALRVNALNDTGNWEINLGYDESKHRWVAKAKHVTEEGDDGLERQFVEWSGN